MLFEALEIVREQVSNYIALTGLGTDMVALDSIALFENTPASNDKLDNKVVLSLLNIEEETSLKNQNFTHFQDGKTVYKNNPIHLNVYIIFSCNRSTYDFSLRSLGAIIEFFQAKKVFNQKNTVFSKNLQVMRDVKEFQFTVELFTPSLEQHNYIWSMLGGKAYPCALYKINVIHLERTHLLHEGTPIQQFNGTLNQI